MTTADAFEPSIEASPKALKGLRGWLLHRLCRLLSCGTLTIVTPGGETFTHRTERPGPEAVLVLHRWRALRRVLLGGDVGFAEAYVDGDWTSPDVTALLDLAARSDASLTPAISGAWPARLANRFYHWARKNTLKGSRRNIVQHYDLGNAFYARWLDSGMAYSSALYHDPEMTLEAAQAAKFQRALELLDPDPGHEVLEIGFGWGGMAERLARLGCRVTGLTLSPSQHEHATRRLGDAGLGDRADLRVQDYREADGSYDRIVSIEMFEAVGEAYWPAYFERLRATLKDGGAAVLQVITIADERFETYRREPDFIQRHIFPGGMLPSPTALRAEIAKAGLIVEAVECFGLSYARTLREWRDRFHASWPEIAAMGFPTSFRRMWDYYLCYCEAGFKAGAIDVGLWRLAHAR